MSYKLQVTSIVQVPKTQNPKPRTQNSKLRTHKMYPYKIAIIDDNQAVLDVLKLTLEGEFESIITLSHPSFFTSYLNDGIVDAVVLDMNFNSPELDGAEGINWLRYIKSHPHAPAVVMMTAFGNIDLAVMSLQEGAEDFVTKPWDNEELIKKILKSIQKHASRQYEKKEIQEAGILKEQQKATRQMTLDEIKKRHVMEIMDECKGNLTEVAKRLDINRQTLYNQLKKYGILA